jgi:cytochrome b involved in lipid metabolism
MKKELLIAILLGIAGIVFLGFVLTNASKKKIPIQEQTQTSTPTSIQNQTQTFTAKDVATHATTNNCYMIVNGSVYNLTNYLSEHPTDISSYCGTDATVVFNTRGGKGPHDAKATNRLETMFVGTLAQ